MGADRHGNGDYGQASGCNQQIAIGAITQHPYFSQ